MFTWMAFMAGMLVPRSPNDRAVVLLFDSFFAEFLQHGSAGADPCWALCWIFGHPEVYILILPPSAGIRGHPVYSGSRVRLSGHGLLRI